MINEPRKHHYIPEFYLAGFTNRGLKKDILWTFDQTSLKQWESKPSNIGFQKDYYKININDSDPYGVEKGFSKVESMSANVIKEIIHNKVIPKGEDYIILMNFIALLQARVPSRRESFTEPMGEVLKMSLQLTYQYHERYEALIEQMKRDGYETNDSISFEEMRDFIYKEDAYTIDFDNNTHISNLMVGVDAMLPYLLDRKWTILFADDSDGYFICSDSPVSLHWSKPREKSFWGVGFAHKNTDVTVPLNKSVLLLGRFEEKLPTQKINRRSIAVMNSYTCSDSKRYVYSCNKDFIWYMENDQIGNKNDLIEALIKSKNPQ